MKRARHAQFLLALVTGVGLFASLPAEVSAAPAGVQANTNLRMGPGTNYSVVATVPAGSTVDISGCGGQWCTAHWRGMTGYMIANNLDMDGSGPDVVAPPPAVYYEEPDPYYGPPGYYYGGPRYRYWDRRSHRRHYHRHHRGHW